MKGKKLIVILVALCLAAAGYGWLHRRQATYRAAQYWGADATQLVRIAPRMEWLEIRPLADARANAPALEGERLLVDGQTYRVLQRRSLTGARGLLHLRHALLADSSYRWLDPAPDAVAAPTPWRQVLRFGEPDHYVDLFLAPEGRLIGHRLRGVAEAARLQTTPQFARGLEFWIDDTLQRR